MDLFIKIDENNNFVNHPSVKENLQLAFPSLDWNSSTPPSGWLKFEKTPQPYHGPYKKIGDPMVTYQIVDGVAKDVWNLIDYTDDEKKAKQDRVKAKWAALPAEQRPASWTFNEDICDYEAPVAPPADAASETNHEGKIYKWDESSLSWKELTE